MRFSRRTTEQYDYPRLCAYQDSFNQAEFGSHVSTSFSERTGVPTCLYIHIPFCRGFCNFCNYYKVKLSNLSEFEISQYIDVLIKEIAFFSANTNYPKIKLSGIHFGGGTPTILPSSYYERIMKEVRAGFDLSECQTLSIEGSPLTLLGDKVVGNLRAIGFNRVSFGVQTFDNALRKKYGLAMKREDIEALFNVLDAESIKNVNIDLMYHFPEQTPDNIIRDIENAFILNATSIDLYSLNVFPNTQMQSVLQKQGLWDKYIDNNWRNSFIEIYNYMAANRDYKFLMSNTISKTEHVPPITLAAHLGGNQDNGANVIGIGPSSRGYINGYAYRNEITLSNYIKAVQARNIGVAQGLKLSNEEIENRTLVMFPNFTFINKAHAKGLERHRETINKLISHQYIIETEDRLEIAKAQCYWAGNISTLLYSKEQQRRAVKSVLNSRKNRVNFYNQDKMQIINS